MLVIVKWSRTGPLNHVDDRTKKGWHAFEHIVHSLLKTCHFAFIS